MILAWTNLWDDGPVTAGQQLVNMPGSNTQHPHLTRQWHAGVPETGIAVDLGSPQPAALAAVLGSNLTAAATVRVMADDTDPTGSEGDQLDTGLLSGEFGHGGACYITFSSQAARYWRIGLADVSLGGIQVGRIFLGQYWDATRHLPYRWQIVPHDRSSRLVAPGGTVFSQKRRQQRELSFTLEFATEAEMYENGFAAAAEAGQIVDVLAIPQRASPYRWQQAVWGLLEEPVPIIHEAANQYGSRYTLLERI